jgi:DNA-binding NtrC family response regulator
MLFKKIVYRLGNEAVVVESCKAGLKLVKERRFNLVFLDMYMLEAEGVETFVNIRDICPHMRVVIMGGTLDGKLMSAVLPYGSFAVLNKPLRESDIVQIINSIVRV